jgi:hypothetical protein
MLRRFQSAKPGGFADGHTPLHHGSDPMRTKRKRMTLHQWDGVTVLDLGEIEIWDGADLALLRETLTRLIEREKCRSLGVNLRWVKYIPSGFFGMLFDWHERGVAVRLYTPQRNVANMLWFRQFFEDAGNGCFVLLSQPKQDLVLPDETRWNRKSTWKTPEPQPMAVDTPV